MGPRYLDPAEQASLRSVRAPRRKANPADTLGPRVSTSRRSILASMASEPADASPEPGSPVSNTDALLRTRRPSSANSQSVPNGDAASSADARSNSRSSRRKSVSNKGRAADSPSPNADASHGSNALRHQPSNLSSRERSRSNSAQPEIDEDRRSISSRRSSRAIISSIMRRGSRQGSEDEGGKEARSRSGSTTSNRRSMSQRMSSFSKKSGAGAAAASNGSNGRDEQAEEREAPPPVPALPASSDVPEHPLRSGGSSPAVDAAPARIASVPASPALSASSGVSGAHSGRRMKFNKKAADGSAKPVRTVQTVAPPLHVSTSEDLEARDVEQRIQPQQQKSSEGTQDNSQQQGYIGAAVGAAVGAGAAVAGGAAALAGKVLGGSGEQANGKPERDADYSSEDEEFHDAELADIAEHDEDDGPAQRPNNRGRASHHSQSRSRGLSESTATTLAGDNESARGAPAALRGTAGAKRRSGSEPVGADETSTPADAKAKKETPTHVREKAARVAKLTFDDVNMDADEMERDIAEARRALNLFLNSRMLEAEEIMKKHSDRKLYYALGDALIAVIKGFMTFEPEDLAKAISYCKDALTIANLLRKPAGAVASFGRFVRGSGASTGTMASMSKVQRHAELVYAESLLLKAVMGILYSGDFFAFVSEALNLRNSYGIYRSMSKYVEWSDEQAQKKNGAKRDDSVDEDFRSGVYLGNGLISMILGLLPGKVLKIMEVFGYTGDCEWGLMTLARAGEWSDNKKELQPAMDQAKEGLRRQVCDMGILLYHLVISTFIPVSGTDIDFADKVLHYNLERYPQGVFFLYFSGRLYSTEALAEKAIKQYRAARDVQREYVQLQHICYWDMSLCHMSLAQWKEAYECFTILLKESNWSKAVYTYGRAVNLAQTGQDDREAAALFRKVPEAMQRIAGKSIPMEKYCARKAKKFISQKRLLLPAIEFSYIYHCLTNAPRYALADEQLVEISDALADLRAVEDPSSYHSGADEYWDDYCLAHFLRGVTLRYIAYPEKHARVDPKESPIPVEEAAKQCQISLQNVIDEGDKISLDHYLVYFAHYELGRLYACQGKIDQARTEFNIIMSSKHLVQHKGKYSMQNMCILRSNGALETLK